MPGVLAKSASDSPGYVAPPAKPSRSGRSGVTTRMATAVLGHLPFGVAVIDEDIRLLYWNEHAAGLFGLPPLMAEDGPPLMEILGGIVNLSIQQRERIVAFAATHIAAGDRAEPDSCLRISIGRGRRFAIQVHGIGGGRWMLVIDDGKMTAGSAGTNQVQGGSVAWLDALTGLGNRRHLNQVMNDLTENMSAASRHALLMIDLDGFKAVNDSFGHAVGDALLCLVAQRLRRETRDDDTLVRLGGDEFVILITTSQHAEVLAARVVNALSRPYLVEGHLATIGASVGLARFPQHGPSWDDMTRYAELALYDAKNAGRGTWRVYAPSMAPQILARRDLETGLRRALALGELSLAYQPQLNIATQAVTGFEAFLRWHHPRLGDVPPDVFIPVAEQIGCIAALGEWVVKTACLQAMRWPAPLSVAVNVSPQQFKDGDLLFETIQGALQTSGLPPERLELDITEQCLLLADTPVLQTLHRFHAAGVRVAIDDFGIGLASINQLRSFPFSTIKIDRSFIADLGTNDRAAPFIRSITAVGAELGIRVTAEGVETTEQSAHAEALGCTDIQGFLLSRPMQAADVESFLGRHGNLPPAA